MSIKLTQEEANALINMIKQTLKDKSFMFPKEKGNLVFDVVGENKDNVFVINIQRKGINAKGCSYQARSKDTNTILMRLDVNPTAVHLNPSNNKKIKGTHLHIYNEDYGINEAIPFDVKNADLHEICYIFFKKFNIIKYPEITYQCKFKELG